MDQEVWEKVKRLVYFDINGATMLELGPGEKLFDLTESLFVCLPGCRLERKPGNPG